MPKLSTVEDLQRQLDIVSLCQWVRGDPVKFQSACLIIRTDAKVEVDEETFKRERGWDRTGWREGHKATGYRYFLVGAEHTVSPAANRYIAKARQELGYFAKSAKSKFSPDGLLCPDMDESAGVAYPINNIHWNDLNAKKGQAQEVLQLAVQLAEKRSRKVAA